MKQGIQAKNIALIALLLTVFLLFSIILIANYLNTERRDVVSEQIQQTYNSLNEMQTFLLMSETYGNEMACIAFTQKLDALDTSVWNLGIKLDQYQVASEELRKQEFYSEQKKTFNEQQLIYMLLLRNLQQKCDYKQTVIEFYYRNSEDCKKCDDQSFVLTDINEEYDRDISIFSYDADLNLTSVNLLMQYHRIDSFPCVVIDDIPYCGMQDKEFILRKICDADPTISRCATDLSSAQGEESADGTA
jgi:hypothetical protein